MGKKVFISHAAADAKLVKILLGFLNGIGIQNDDIFCTSISGGMEGGVSFVEQIKNNVLGSKVVIFLLSERFFLSYFCLAELGAAWASNPNILPVFIPPISNVEYDRTPLIGIQALSMGSDNFADELFNDIVRKNVIASNSVSISGDLFNNFNDEIQAELNILRKDNKGFYVARLLDSYKRETSQRIPTTQSLPDQFLTGTRNNIIVRMATRWRLNGLLDVEKDASINEDWIDVGSAVLSSKKLLFELGEQIEQNGNQRVFIAKSYYELP